MTTFGKLKQNCSSVWSAVRELSGDDAYERYLKHQVLSHPTEQPLDRAAYFKAEQQRKWEGVRRCC